MRTTLYPVLLLITVFALSACSGDSGDKYGGSESSGGETAKKIYMESATETALDDSMDEINGSVKKLKSLLDAATLDQAATDKHITAMLGNIEKYKKVKITAEGVDDASKQKYIAAWEKTFGAYEAALKSIQAAVKAGDKAKAATAFAQISEVKKDGHRKFKKGINKDLIK